MPRIPLGILLLVLGTGSLLLPLLEVRPWSLSLIDFAQPVAGIVIAALGGLLVFLGARQNA